MLKLTINNKSTEAPANITVIQACEYNNIEIPRFCYHHRLAIAGNCRMCLVEVIENNAQPKMVPSCILSITENMQIFTNTPKIKHARENVMEFLLINHPLDCPICDQGGECDLQDQAMKYGKCSSRFNINKRAVAAKYFGPLIKDNMTRCIHCTRCVRFLDEVAGTNELGIIHRGEKAEITTYKNNTIKSELSGNIIDLCPVGALTSRPYAFKARPWELKHSYTIDILDAVGSNIRVDSKNNEVLRILPRTNEDINEEWISDKTRFACDGLKLQRLDQPLLRQGSKLIKITWQKALNIIAQNIQDLTSREIAAIAGNLADCESMFLLKTLMHHIGCYNIDCRQEWSYCNHEIRCSYILNTGIKNLEQSDLILLIGANPRFDAPLVNTRIRKAYIWNNAKIYNIGTTPPLNYKATTIDTNPQILESILNHTHPLSAKLLQAKKPAIIIGQNALSRTDGDAILYYAMQIAENFNLIKDNWNGFNVLHNHSSRVGGLDLQFIPTNHGKNITEILQSTKNNSIKLIYLLGADEIEMSSLGNVFVIYQGHHGDNGAHRANIILPSAAYTEKSATYVNTEGRVQQTIKAVNPPGNAKEDWEIIRDLGQLIINNKKFNYKNINEVRNSLKKQFSIFNQEKIKNNWQTINSPNKINKNPLTYKQHSFYMSDVISRASPTMLKCMIESK